mmetsp:Transcript_53805/g.159366  ORF Transcript_53805/g.159366 Transcript_53805/m.159366 type:complete len:357 (-) Transcript_53805:906-1976(-)
MAVVWRCAVGDAGAADGQPCDECAVAVRRGRLLQHCRLRNAAAVDGVPRDVDPRRLDLQRLHAGASGGDADGADGCAPAAGRRWRRRAAGGARQRGDAAERHGDQRLLLGQLGRTGDADTERRPFCGGATARVDAHAGGQPGNRARSNCSTATAVATATGAVRAVAEASSRVYTTIDTSAARRVSQRACHNHHAEQVISRRQRSNAEHLVGALSRSQLLVGWPRRRGGGHSRQQHPWRRQPRRVQGRVPRQAARMRRGPVHGRSLWGRRHAGGWIVLPQTQHRRAKMSARCAVRLVPAAVATAASISTSPACAAASTIPGAAQRAPQSERAQQALPPTALERGRLGRSWRCGSPHP